MEPIFVYVTCKDRAEALQVGKVLVEERLAACANVIDGMESIYWWKGQLEVGKEAVLILKSRDDLLEELTKKSNWSIATKCLVWWLYPSKAGIRSI